MAIQVIKSSRVFIANKNLKPMGLQITMEYLRGKTQPYIMWALVWIMYKQDSSCFK